MELSLLHYAFLVLELFVSFSLAVYTVSMLFSFWRGAPYVATKRKQIEALLKKGHLKRRQKFLELGCGDGRVVRTAVKQYGVIGHGVDINTTLIWLAKFRARIERTRNLTFSTKSIENTDFSTYDVIYLYLLPNLIEKLENKFKADIRPGTLVISHAFELNFFNTYLVATLEDKPYKTFYYKKS